MWFFSPAVHAKEGRRNPILAGSLLAEGWARALKGVLALTFLGFGIFQLGDGVYIAAKAEVAQVLLARAWAETLASGEKVKPWPWADTWPVARLVIPELGEDVIVLESTSGQALAFGPGRMTSLSGFGTPGVSVIAAHNDTHFRKLDELAIGQAILLETADGQVHHYRITGYEVIDTGKPLYLTSMPVSQLVLSTCYPFDVLTSQTRLRYLVYAEWLGSTP